MTERKISPKSLKNLYQSNKGANQLTKESIETALLFLLEKKETQAIFGFRSQTKARGFSKCILSELQIRRRDLQKPLASELPATLKRNGMIRRTRLEKRRRQAKFCGF